MRLPLTQTTADAAGEAKSPSTPSRQRGVLLINLGSPDKPDLPSVHRYLTEFLRDPAVIHLPTGLGWLNGVVGRTIARFRAPHSAAKYQAVWSDRGPPLKAITEDQASALEAVLPRGWRVYHAMRYGRPGIAETLHNVEAAGVEELVVLPMYPQFSGPTTGTALRLVYDHLKGDGHQIHVTIRNSWCDDQGYINAQAELIEEYAASNDLTPDNAYLLFSTHGLPAWYARAGDPYPEHVARTVGLVRRRLGWPTDRMSLAYQSRFGPIEWLKPYTDEVLADLARAGEKRVLVCPISFIADCLETLDEIDVRYRRQVEEAGAELYLCPALNTFGPFITALKHLVLRGPRPMSSRGLPQIPSCGFQPARSFAQAKACGSERRRSIQCDPRPSGGDIDSLVMIGISLRGRLGTGRGPELTYTDPEGFRGAKRSQCEVPALLRTIQEHIDLREPWLLNTCHRFELYGWAGGARRDSRTSDRSHVVAQIRRRLFESDAGGARRDSRTSEGRDPCTSDARTSNGLDDGRANVLYGADAWHHLLRTAVGLNSGLPGERDVIEQLQAAHRLADRAGTAGPLMRRLLADVLAFERNLRDATDWGGYDPDYTYAAFSRLVCSMRLDLPACRIVVIGGSTTSAGVLRTLTGRFDVPGRQLTLIYRGHRHGGQIKMLRKAVGHGRRIRVQSYAERRVTSTIADADVVVFGVDRDEPVLYAGQLRECRDWLARPLTIFDFNTFGSTTGMEELAGVTLYEADRLETEATAFAEDICATEEFARAVDVTETSIIEHVAASQELSIGARDDLEVARSSASLAVGCTGSTA